MKKTIAVILLVVMGLSMVSTSFADTFYSDKKQATYFGSMYEAGYTPRKYMKDAESRAVAVWVAVMQLNDTFGFDLSRLDLNGDTKAICVGHPAADSVLSYADSKKIWVVIPVYDGNVCVVEWSSEYNFAAVRVQSSCYMKESRKVDQATLWAVYDYLFDE